MGGVTLLLLPKGKKQPIYTKEETQEEEKLPSVFSILPYEGDGFAIYYFRDEELFTITVRQYPYDEKIQEALSILHRYEETKDFTEEDVSIDYPAIYYREY